MLTQEPLDGYLDSQEEDDSKERFDNVDFGTFNYGTRYESSLEKELEKALEEVARLEIENKQLMKKYKRVKRLYYFAKRGWINYE